MLDIAATKITPRVSWEEEGGILRFEGDSYPENSFSFFEPIFRWLDTELERIDRLCLSVNMAYMNSSSTKCMLDILDQLEDASTRGMAVTVTWYYQAGNERALDLAEEFLEDLSLPFSIVPVEGP